MYRPLPAPRLLDGDRERSLQPWEIASAQIMVREAGGTISGMEGSTWCAGLNMCTGLVI
jgi:fructose-1,6-bisphosphatase/inositol monophosphatase family enzyme